ncbi:MAG TPA: hypothetical protein VFZ34_15895 [Blastocatellia bacterium]|nr:hypothetical protein [Blastocatellia bacterium]
MKRHQAQMIQHDFLRQVWSEIERLPPLQRCVLLLGTPAEEMQLFWVHGVVSLRQIGRTINLTREQFQLAWLLLEWRADQREQAQRVTDYDEQFALLWQQLPLNDLTVAALLSTSQNNIIHLRRAAHRRLHHSLAAITAPQD